MDDEPVEDETPDAQLVVARAVLQATITIVRKATGKVETYTLTGTPTPPAGADDDKGR